MLVKILGGTDLVGGLVLLFGNNLPGGKGIMIFFGVVFLIKSSLGLWRDFGSWIDVSVGVIFLLRVLFNIPYIVLIILAFLLLQKGIFSFI